MTVSNGAYPSLHVQERDTNRFRVTEPGYYEDGKFGIRIENVVVVREAVTPHNFGEKGYLGFEHLTMVLLTSRRNIDVMNFPSDASCSAVTHAQEPDRRLASHRLRTCLDRRIPRGDPREGLAVPQERRARARVAPEGVFASVASGSFLIPSLGAVSSKYQ